jgi:hypothetical protein
MTIAQICELIVLIGGVLGSLVMGGLFFGLGSWLCGLAGGYLLPYGYLTQNQALGGVGLVLRSSVHCSSE